MPAFLSPIGGASAQFLDNNSNVLSGGKLWTYAAGTTTPLASYTTSAGNIAHTNPIILDSAGRIPNGGEVWLNQGISYKFVLMTSTNVTLVTWDNISGINDGSLIALPNGSVTSAKLASSIALTGDPTAPTPGRFDNDISVATTAFVQQSLGNFRNYLRVLTTSGTLTAADSGGLVQLAASSVGTFTVTLPLANSVPFGSTITLFVTNFGQWNVAVQGSDGIAYGGVPALVGGDTITLWSNGLFSWFPIYQPAGLSRAFPSSFSGNGWQKLPSGLIIQWGSGTTANSTVIYPITFPTAALSIVFTTTPSVYFGGAPVITGQIVSQSVATVNCLKSTDASIINNAPYSYIVVGY